ncbi:MAG: gamma-glutamyltransferase, partial [Gammaproteobacteria bacterium]
LAAGIPGLPAALVHLVEQHGQRTLAQNLAPAVRLARDGFETGPRYGIMAGFRAKAFQASPEASGIFLVSGEAPEVGTRIVQADLAATLESIGRDGGESFYRGELAAKLVAGVRAEGG